MFGSANTSTPNQQSSSFAFGTPSNTNNSATSNTGFGTQPASGGLFGSQQKPAFGSAGSTGGGLFGQANQNTTTSPFGGSTFGQSLSNQNPVPVTGTSQPPFEPFLEKDPTTNSTNHFQTISFLPAYRNASLEELRFQDYAQNRRFGNQSGQGSFGQQPTSTGFGGSTFGGSAIGGGLFGQNPQQQQQPATGGLFGQNTSNTFGASPSNTTTSGGLFGGFGQQQQQQQPQQNSLFGQPQNQQSGGLFGNTTSTPSAFGSSNTFGQQPAQSSTNAFGFTGSTSNSPFGINNQQQQQQQKPAFSFGASNTGSSSFNTTPNNQFGSTTGAFGSSQSPSSGGFGQPQQNAASTPSFSFGANNQNTTPGSSGAFNAFSQPNQTDNKPAFSLGNTQSPTTGGLFGQNNNTQQQAQKPAFSFGASNTGVTGTQPNLFGNSQTQGSNLFGNNTQSTPSGGLFGNLNQQQPQQNQQQNSNLFQPKPFGSSPTGGLFSGATSNTQNQPSSTGSLGGGLFGNASQQQPSSGLFGSTNTTQPFQQQNTNPFGSTPPSNSLFGINNQAKPANSLQASIDQNPFGANPLFQNVINQQSQSPQSIGPIATPLVTNNVQQKPAALPAYKLTPRIARRPLHTSPFFNSRLLSAAASAGSSPGNRSVLDGVGDTSVLTADAFTPRKNIKDFIIARRETDSENTPNSVSSPRRVIQDVPHPDKLVETDANVSVPPPKTTDTLLPKDTSAQKENQVPEVVYQSPAAPGAKLDDMEGAYWTYPTISKLKEYSSEKMKAVQDFKVGRRGYGQVSFSQPVDLTSTNLDEIPGKLILFDIKVCIVYPEEDSEQPPGMGLNVPATITLEKCWPLSKETRQPIIDPDNPRFQQHIQKLRKMPNTEFIDYMADNGVWIFRVQHFSRYGLPDEEDDDEDGDQQNVRYASS